MQKSDPSAQRKTQPMRVVGGCLAALLAMFSLACGPEDGRDEIAELGPITRLPFAVTDFFTPSGHMGDGAEAGFIFMNVDRHCKTPRPGAARGKCYNFDYRPGVNLWAGVYWVFPSNNWGSRTGRRYKPWEFDAATGQIRQRYTRVKFQTAAVQDTFRLDLSGAGSAGTTYILRDAVFQVAGPTMQTVTGNHYMSASSPHAIVNMAPGAYTITLQDGWSLWTSGAMGAAVPATLAANAVSFNIDENTTTSTGFDFTAGAETVRIALSTPPVRLEFYAGQIADTTLLQILCAEPGKRCEHTDTVATVEREFFVTREWMEATTSLLIPPPCVRTGSMPAQRPGFVKLTDNAMTPYDDVGLITCPAETLNAAGEVAMCDGSLKGGLNPDGSVACCASGDPSRAADTDPWGCPEGATPIPGFWRNVNQIESWLIGGFGWAMNYAQFEDQNATIIANGVVPDPAAPPPTNILIDDIVWTSHFVP